MPIWSVAITIDCTWGFGTQFAVTAIITNQESAADTTTDRGAYLNLLCDPGEKCFGPAHRTPHGHKRALDAHKRALDARTHCDEALVLLP